LGSIDLPGGILPLNPAAGDIVELVWQAKQLTAD